MRREDVLIAKTSSPRRRPRSPKTSSPRRRPRSPKTSSLPEDVLAAKTSSLPEDVLAPKTVYELRQPLLAVMDPDMLKTVLVKDCFTHFTNHRQSAVVSVKGVFGSYSMDVMGSCILSVDMDVINTPSEALMQHANDWLGVAFFSRKSFTFFKSIVEKIRRDRNDCADETRADLLQYLTRVQAGHKLKGETYQQVLSDHELLCQLVMFVVGGFDTSASTLTFVAYNLALNPAAMSRLQDEINDTFPNDSVVEFAVSLHRREYLDCVLNESLRLYPPIARTDRVAKETVSIKGITIPKNMVVMVPFYALHRDPELWPEPQEFRPERFSKENRQKIRPYSYMPFGVGPRNCVGMRFAQAAVKLALVDVLRRYSFSVCEETEIPLEMNPQGLMGTVRPIRLRIQQRSAI
ncbi:cytochrome P450 3A56-like [Eucyclogobius newberryi]|uniref:cytochrome P450 3A56-like n=1 Tax=Eucyclogobius newberryi TaxID=166745 RepID=UPI003B5A94C2